MASPQLEDGFTQIAHEIMEALAQINLSPYESRALWFILRKTYGWKKKRDWIAQSQFSKGLKLDRRHAHRALRGLLSKKMAVICRDDKNRPTYGFQKDYSKWKLSSVEMTKTKSVIGTGAGVSSVQAYTKETLTKEERIRGGAKAPSSSSSKKGKSRDPDPATIPEWINQEIWTAYLEMRAGKKKPATENAKQIIIRKLERWRAEGQDVSKILETSIVNSWTDVYLPKHNQKPAGGFVV